MSDSHDAEIGTDKSLRPEIVDIGSVVRRHSATRCGFNLYQKIR